jgi:hypothetical protein
MNQEPAALDRRAAEAQPHPPARLKLDEMTSDDLDHLHDQLARAEAAGREAERLRTDLTDAREWEQYGRQLAARAADTAMTACKNHDRLRKEAEQRAEQAEAAVARVCALHRKASHGDTCVYCAHGQRLGYDTTWPCDTIRALDEPASGPAPTQATDSTAARTARIRSLTLPASGRQLDPHVSRRLPGILHLGHRPTSLDMVLIAEAADVSVDWLLYGDAGTPAPAPAGLREQPAPTVDRQTAAVLAALHRSAEADVSRVIDLYERWVKTGPPPIGTSVSRWWDIRLAELHTAILNPAKEQS